MPADFKQILKCVPSEQAALGLSTHLFGHCLAESWACLKLVPLRVDPFGEEMCWTWLAHDLIAFGASHGHCCRHAGAARRAGGKHGVEVGLAGMRNNRMQEALPNEIPIIHPAISVGLHVCQL